MNQIMSADDALPGRAVAMRVSEKHFITGRSTQPPFATDLSKAMFGLGCFWGAEKIFWLLEGVYTTAVGYSAGHTPNPEYQEVCSGQTGHNEVVQIVFDEKIISYTDLLTCFWESHNPTQGMQQGNDVGTQYRSGIYTYNEEQLIMAKQSLAIYQQPILVKLKKKITTEIKNASEFYYAEDYHQQYLGKNPEGYCGLGGLGVAFPK